MTSAHHDGSLAEHNFHVDFSPKAPISCILTAKDGLDLSKAAALTFTHGSGGTLRSDAMANFVSGFAKIAPILCFQGNMNLPSRTKMFGTVCKDRGASTAMGGRSMGARAAVMAATEETSQLVLVSYPLHTEKQTRDQILLDLPAEKVVLFVSGDHDAMCALDRLQEVRSQMKCHTWMVIVKGADHGMNVKPKAGTESVGMETGEVVARWLENRDRDRTEGTISWDANAGMAFWSGWSSECSYRSDEVDREALEARPVDATASHDSIDDFHSTAIKKRKRTKQAPRKTKAPAKRRKKQ